MISSVHVKGFQSLYDIEVPLSPFTVITGPSSTGKSAFIRSLRLLMQNARGTSFISHGEDTTEVTARLEPHPRSVTIRRGKTNEYEVTGFGGATEKYTKLGGEVPEDVKNFLGIDPSVSIANQFDPPFLLTASGSEVARTLGSLTNVDVVMAAAREANRRKLQASSDARASQSALDAAQEELAALPDLDERRLIVEDAEHAYNDYVSARGLAESAARVLEEIKSAARALKEITIVEIPETEELFGAVRAAAKDARAAEDLLQALRGISIPEVTVIPEVEEELAAARDAASRYDDFQWLQMEVHLKIEAFTEAKSNLEDRSQEFEHYVTERLRLLREAGVCPTCGQDTHDLH